MSSCMTLSTGICRSCKNNIGGVRKAYVADAADVQWPVTTYNGDVTDVTLAQDANWYLLLPDKYQSSFTENISVNDRGSVYYNGVISLVFSHLDKTMKEAVAEMAKGDLVMIIEDNNGTKFFCGEKFNEVAVSGGSFETGTSQSDANGATIEFQYNTINPAMTVVPEAGGDLETALASADSACQN